MKRWAKSYSIVDHQLLHGGYLKRLSHQALALYLFFAVVGDREGKSFYKPASIVRILRLSDQSFFAALKEFLNEGLIDQKTPYFYLVNLT